jgi:hypothetical protein
VPGAAVRWRHASLHRGAFSGRPLDRQLARSAGWIETPREAAAVPQLPVLEKLRFDAVRAVIAELARDAIGAALEREESLAGLRLPRSGRRV